MEVKLLTLMAGPDGVKQPGAILNLPAKQARQMIADGQAIPVPAKKQTAANAQRETRQGDNDDNKEPA